MVQIFHEEKGAHHGLEEAETGRGRVRLIAALMAGLVIILTLAGLWYAYQQSDGMASGPPPVVVSDPSPVKVTPENPGGMQVQNQDKQIYEELSGNRSSQKPGVERLLPPPEKPMLEPVERNAQPVPSPAPTAAPPASMPPTASPTAAPPLPPANQTASTVVPPPAPSPTGPTTQPAPSPVTRDALPAHGGFKIQLGAFRTTAEAEAAWSKIKARFPNELGRLNQLMERADLGDKGIFYRLQAGPFSERAAAASVCDSLKAQSQACVIVGR